MSGGQTLPRGTVTLLLADIEGSTRLWESRPDEMAGAIARLDAVVAAAVDAHDGVRPVEQGEGDSFVVAFVQATDAVACALALQLEFGRPENAWPFRVRMALHAGEVQLRDEHNYVGTTIARCARLRALAHGGQTVVSQSVHDIASDTLPAGASLEDMGTHRLRDLSRPERVFQLRHPDLPVNPAPLRSLDVVPNNLPFEPTSFVGRVAEIEAVSALVRSDRVVTLLGTGGCGKTRLSLQVGAEVLEEFRDGVWFVELAPVEDAGVVPQALADVIGVRTQAGQPIADAVTAAIGDDRVLVVLDNCEHVISAAASLADALLRRCRGVTVLATSREPLGVPGELTFSIPSLSVPDERSAHTSSEAVELFADRAASAMPAFAINDTNAPAVADICRRLDGIPLAIELAAARIRALAPEQIRDGLADRFRLLTSGARTLTPRQQTLRASVDWSYDLLSEAERVALRRLSIFAGGFELEAAHAVLEGDDVDRVEVVDLVSSLVDKSLIAFDPGEDGAAPRYRMLETIRQYGHERLVGAGESDTVAARHRAYVNALLRRAAAEEEGPNQWEWTQRVRREFDNVRVALKSAKEAGDGAGLLELTCLAGNTWTIAGQSTEHRDWLQTALALAPDDAPFQPNALYQLGVTDSFTGDLDAAIDHIGASIPLYRAQGDESGALWALAEYAWNVALHRGMPAGLPLYDDAIALARALGERGALLSLEYGLATCQAYTGHLDLALEIAEAAAAGPPVVEHFHRWLTIIVGWVLARLGRVDEGITTLERAAAESVAAGDTASVGLGAWMMCDALRAGGRADEAGPHVAAGFEAARGFGSVVEGPAHGAAALAALAEPDASAALRHACTAIELAQPVAESWVVMFSLVKADAQEAAGDLEGAVATLEACASSSRANDFPAHLADALIGLGGIALDRGDAARAADLVHEALPIFTAMGHRAGMIDALETLANCLLADERHEDGARLWGAAQAARAADGYRWRAPWRGVRAVAGTAGPVLGLRDAADLAARGRGERKRPTSGWAALSPTEEKVAALVAEGLTNAQVGERLFISRHTVDTHLRHIFAKLGIANRAELAGAAARRIT
jgi:predicted ATPase/DNA-binding CsgD family transcriptional regulator